MSIKRTFHLTLLLTLLSTLLVGCAGMNNKPGPLTAPADPQSLPPLAGDYAINGTDMTDADYGGTLHIEAGESAGTYQLTYLLTESIQRGTGHIEGNQLIVTWEAIDGTLSGTAVYTITTSGQLDGIRTIDGVDGKNRERGYPNP